MNAVSSSTRTESHEVEVIITDEDGNETTRTETVTETILEITITHKTPEEMARQYSFNPRQNEYLALMSEPENQSLWAELLGGYTSGGQIMNPNTRLARDGHFPMAAAAKLHDNVVVRLPGGPFHRGDCLSQRNRHRRAGRNPHPGRGGRGRHHCQRHRLLGRRIWVPHQGKAQRYLRNAVCPLLLHLRNRWAGSKAG